MISYSVYQLIDLSNRNNFNYTIKRKETDATSIESAIDFSKTNLEFAYQWINYHQNFVPAPGKITHKISLEHKSADINTFAFNTVSDLATSNCTEDKNPFISKNLESGTLSYYT